MKRQIILHIDTTGMKFNKPESKSKSRGDRILQIDAIELMDGKPTGDDFYTKLNPEHSISREATQIHHLKKKDVKDEPVFAEIKEKFLKYIAGAEVIVINPWVKSFFNSELHRFDKEDNINNYCKTVTYLPKLHKELHPDAPKYGLDGLCTFYKIKPDCDKRKVMRMLQIHEKICNEMAVRAEKAKKATVASHGMFAKPAIKQPSIPNEQRLGLYSLGL